MLAAATALPYIEGLRLALAARSDQESTRALPCYRRDPGHSRRARRARAGLAPIAPDRSLTQAADFLRMMRGERASADEEYALDAYLVTVSEHE